MPAPLDFDYCARVQVFICGLCTCIHKGHWLHLPSVHLCCQLKFGL
jgi:hypothetical protein